MLSRTEGETRRAVHGRLQELVPAQLEEAAVLRLDPARRVVDRGAGVTLTLLDLLQLTGVRLSSAVQ